MAIGCPIATLNHLSKELYLLLVVVFLEELGLSDLFDQSGLLICHCKVIQDGCRILQMLCCIRAEDDRRDLRASDGCGAQAS